MPSHPPNNQPHSVSCASPADRRQEGGEAIRSETSLEKWRRRHARAAQQEADLCALGFTAREAKAQIDDEWARLIWRAHQSGATGPQIGRALGLGRARANQLCQRGKRRVRCTFPTPLKAACAEGLPEAMQAYFEPLRLSEQQDRSEYARLVAKYGIPATTTRPSARDICRFLGEPGQTFMGAATASPADRQGQVPGKPK